MSPQKLDYYRNHAFLSLVVHRTLGISSDDDDEDDEKTKIGQQSGHRFGFHTSRRSSDEESIVDSREARSQSPGYGSGATTLAAAGSYAAYCKSLGKAMDKIKTPAELERRTVSLVLFTAEILVLTLLLTAEQLTHNARGLSNRIKEKRGSKKFRKSLNERAAARWTVAELTKDVKVHVSLLLDSEAWAHLSRFTDSRRAGSSVPPSQRNNHQLYSGSWSVSLAPPCSP